MTSDTLIQVARALFIARAVLATAAQTGRLRVTDVIALLTEAITILETDRKGRR